jgi:hypothetical protein
MIQVEKRTGLSHKEFVKEYLEPCRPVVISDATTEWKAHERWSTSYFREKFGNRKVHVMGKEYVFSDFLDLVENSTPENPSPYLNEVNIVKLFPELMEDLTPYLRYALPDRLQSRFIPASWGMRQGVVELLIAGKGTTFPGLHYDGYHMHTFVTQIRGDKEFYFFPPDQTPYMYPEEKMPNRSRVKDMFNPDLEKFPLFKKAVPSMIVVKQGETMFIPSGWWHSTRILSTSLAVSINSINNKMWDYYIQDFFKIHPVSPAKMLAYKCYFKLTGLAMSITEKATSRNYN